MYVPMYVFYVYSICMSPAYNVALYIYPLSLVYVPCVYVPMNVLYVYPFLAIV